MVQDRNLSESLLDPLQFDALLSVFEGSSSRTVVSPGSIENLSSVLVPSEDNDAFKDLRETVDGYPQPCLVVSDAGLISALNQPAYTAFDLEVSDHVDLCGLETLGPGTLSDAIAQVIASNQDGHQTRFVRAYFRDAKRPILLAIVPQNDRKQQLKQALIFIVDIGWDEAASKFIARAYDLSQAEQDILEMFILGNSLGQIAEARARSRRTVTTQFYSALGKCGLSSQVDLVREVVAGSMFQSLGPRVANAAQHPHRRELLLMKPDGRSLEVVASGDFAGAPVFLLSSVGVQRFAPQKTRKFKEAGICIYAVSPPELGRTDPAPKGQHWLDCLADDVCFFMDQMQIARAPFTAAGPSLLSTVRLALRRPERMTEIQSWISIPPTRFQAVSGFAKTVNAVSAIGNASLISPAASRLVARSGLRAWAVLGTRKMAKIQARTEPKILDSLLEHETLQAIDEGFKSSIRQGFTSTLINLIDDIHTDWFADAEACQVPITMVHGRKDQTNSIESVRSFAQALPDKISLIEVEDGGGFLHITHEDVHVACLAKLAHGADIETLS